MEPLKSRSFSGSLSRADLQRHVLRSYLVLRLGIAIIGILFPFILLVGGLIARVPAQDSMSAYYHAVAPGGASMRNVFVGLLFAVSISLGLYRGFSRTEDRLLDAAAFFGMGIAMFPMDWNPCCDMAGSLPFAGAKLPILGWYVHGACAIAFFLCIALVCWFCADDTLDFVKSHVRQRLLRFTYKAIALAMPMAMLAAWVLNNSILRNTKAVFWTETAGICAFGVYWLLKGIELNETAVDLLAVSGKLRQQYGRVEELV